MRSQPKAKRALKSKVVFPPHDQADDSGLILVGGDLSTDTLVSAYSQGIFPWPREGFPLLWFSPPARGILDFKDLHWAGRFLREVRKRPFTIKANTAFSEVIRACASVPRSHETGTWIVPELIEGYERLHKAGHAFSLEAWKGDRLVGGVYGVYIGGVLTGESMFYRESNASKLCLYELIEAASEFGITWMDIQMVTLALEDMGGKYIVRDEFLERVQNSMRNHQEDWNKFLIRRLNARQD